MEVCRPFRPAERKLCNRRLLALHLHGLHDLAEPSRLTRHGKALAAQRPIAIACSRRPRFGPDGRRGRRRSRRLRLRQGRGAEPAEDHGRDTEKSSSMHLAESNGLATPYRSRRRGKPSLRTTGAARSVSAE